MLKLKVSEFENNNVQRTCTVNKIQRDYNTITHEMNNLRKSSESELVRVNNLSDTRSLEVCSLKSKPNILSDKVKVIDDIVSRKNRLTASAQLNIDAQCEEIIP